MREPAEPRLGDELGLAVGEEAHAAQPAVVDRPQHLALQRGRERARSERDSWAQHRTDASAASRAVCDAWQKALQQWRTHSEQSAERRNRELHGWLLAKYAEEEETVSKGCRADDAARRSARLEREKAEAAAAQEAATGDAAMPADDLPDHDADLQRLS